jgi:CRP-like cAMP-binding protein
MNNFDLRHGAATTRRLAAGELLFGVGEPSCVWQLEVGAMRLDRAHPDGLNGFAQLALPGDLLGLEALAGLNHQLSARAIVPCQARYRFLGNETERHLVMMQGLLQMHKRGGDLIALRTGAAQDRLKCLLVLLGAEHEGTSRECPLPTIRDMAAMIDTAPETVSRILAHLKRSRLLDGRRRQGARFDLIRLRDADWPAGMTRTDGKGRINLESA